MIHYPIDGSAWTEFDSNYTNLSRNPQNILLGLAANAFNLFCKMSTTHSTWSDVLTTYNLSSLLCMKKSSFILSLLISDSKSHKKDMDVLFRLLVDVTSRFPRIRFRDFM